MLLRAHNGGSKSDDIMSTHIERSHYLPEMFSKNACLTGTAMLIPVGLHHLIRCFARQIRQQGKLIPGTVRNSKITNRGPNRWLLCTFEMYIYIIFTFSKRTLFFRINQALFFRINQAFLVQ